MTLNHNFFGGLLSDRSLRRKRLAIYSWLAALILVTAGVAGFALLHKTEAPTDGFDVARADAEDREAEAARATKAKADLEAATVPLVFPSDGTPLRVLYSGGSISEGYYTSAPEKAFRPILTSKLREYGPVEEVGTYKADASVRYVTENFETPENIGLAVIELGTNDSRVEGNAPDFTARFAAYLADLRLKSPNIQFLCLSVWAPSNTRTVPYNDAISAECEKQGGRYVDLTFTFPLSTLRGPEGIQTWGGLSDVAHPNDDGHAALAQMILDRIRH